jgi:hypothetical protein
MKATCAKNVALYLCQRRAWLRYRRRQHRSQRFTYPGKDRHPDRCLVRKVAEDRALGDADAIGDGLRRDRLRTAFAGQYQDRSDDLALPFIAVQTLAGCRLECGWSIHSGRVLELLLVSAYYRIQAVPVWQALKSQGGRDREVSRLF